MEDLSDPSEDLPDLSREYRDTVREEINRINARGAKLFARNADRKGKYPEFDDVSKLSLAWLAQMVSEHLGGSMGKEDVYAIFKANARLLPVDLDERGRLLTAVENQLAECAVRVGVVPEAVDMAERFGRKPPAPSLHPFDFDPQDIGFFRISSWNPNRPMADGGRIKGGNVGKITEISDRAAELAKFERRGSWIRNQALFDRLITAEEESNPGSECPTLFDYQVDERETADESHLLRLRVSRTYYSHHVALRNYMRADHDAYEEVIGRIHGGDYVNGRSDSLADVVRSSPESNIVINVTVQSRSGKVMLIRRPTRARVWSEFYQVGAHETMNWRGPQQTVENWFQLASRALKEEIGIDEEHSHQYFNKIIFSWFGFYVPEASGYFFAHVRTGLSEEQLVESVAKAEGAIEADQIEWMNLEEEPIKKVLATWSHGPWEEQATRDEQGRKWLPHAVMSLTQLWRITDQNLWTI
ncbi:hypothetical protein [Streptomyces mirabilis]|uniref:hypothetical protein n=1 Tax=Streptomyces mirabilis TaxID=68239 RepID=UPI003674A6FD